MGYVIESVQSIKQSKRSVRNDVTPSELFAALDLGTNNCRLLIAKPVFQQTCQSKTLKVVDSYSRIVRLGEGMSDSGELCKEACDRTIKALHSCQNKINQHAITKSRLVATEACRCASNAEVFIRDKRFVLLITGIRLFKNNNPTNFFFNIDFSNVIRDDS